ncbi:hypothetical protein GALMADRAFT_1359834, partial [Galerina marginata CBS 339.88]
EIKLQTNDGLSTLTLCGIIYGGGAHFVSRIIDRSGTVWFHDGISTGSRCRKEQTVDLLSDLEWLSYYEDKRLLYCIYQSTRIYY